MTPAPDPLDEELNGEQAAAILELSRQRVHQLAVAGRIPHVVTPHGRVFTRRGVEQFKAEREAS